MNPKMIKSKRGREEWSAWAERIFLADNESEEYPKPSADHRLLLKFDRDFSFLTSHLFIFTQASYHTPIYAHT